MCPTHGSLTKAGKMRFTLKQQREWRQVKKRNSRETRLFHGKKSKIPRIRNRRNFYKRFIREKI